MVYSENELYISRREEIACATKKEYRQYFCGDLKRPQLLDFIHTEKLEVGISDYACFTADTPHMHKTTADMIYILSGEYHIRIIEKNEEIVLHEGDFISIPMETPYASKAKAGTKTLFVKKCQGNDKVNVEVTAEITRWLSKEI